MYVTDILKMCMKKFDEEKIFFLTNSMRGLSSKSYLLPFFILSVNVRLIRHKIKIHSMSIAHTIGPPSALGTMFLESRVVVRGEALCDGLVPVPR